MKSVLSLEPGELQVCEMQMRDPKTHMSLVDRNQATRRLQTLYQVVTYGLKTLLKRLPRY